MIRRTLLAASILCACSAVSAGQEKIIGLEAIGTYETGVFDESAAEVVAHDAISQRVFVINANDKTVDILGITDPESPVKLGMIDVTDELPDAGGVNSVAVHDGIVAVAVEHNVKQSNGWVAFYDTAGSFLGSVAAGALPDMLTFTGNGKYVLVANEGEPSDDYLVDPEGSVTVIDISNGIGNATVRTAGFGGFGDAEVDAAGVRTPQPYGATVAEDLEPEYIAVSKDSRTAWVALQENNALAVVDIPGAAVTGFVGLGCKDHSLPGNALDASNKDDGINISNWPVCGLYMPDAITAYQSKGNTWLVTANEGDGREYAFKADSREDCEDVNPAWELDGDDCLTYIDESRIGKADLDLPGYDEAATGTLQEDENLGRLKFVTTEGNTDNDDAYEKLYSFGARSFTIRDTDGNIVFDSGDDFEQVVATRYPEYFNSTNDDNDSFDNRSDDKGPEPEGVVVGKVRGRTYAFIGLERMGGIMIYDVTDPASAGFVDYINNRDFTADAESSAAGDLGPEGLVFIKADDSPTGEPLLVVGNEVSGTTTVFRVVAR